MDGVVAALIGAFLVVVLVVAVARFIVDVRRDPDHGRSDTAIDMATGEVAGQGIATAIIAFLERLF